jgi:hypothetical protein
LKKEGKLTEDFKNNEWEVYVADENRREKIVKVAKSKRAAVILYNKLIKTDKYHEVGMRVIKEGKLTEADSTVRGDTYLDNIQQALKKAGIFSRFKKYKVMKGRGVTGRADVGFFITLDKGIVLPLEIRNGYVYYEIEDSHKLGKWTDTNKVARALKKFSKMDGFGQGKLVKKEGKLNERMDKRKAATILKQIGGNRFIAMTGAKDFAFSNKYMSFKIGRNSKGINFVRIAHNGKDLYDMEFGFVSVRGIKVKKKVKDIYADMLGTMFKKYTGMNVRL